MKKSPSINLSLTGLKTILIGFLHRFHVMVFVVTVLGGLVVVILLLNGIIIRSGEAAGYTSNSNNASFDQQTIKKVEELKTSDQTDDKLVVPSGRNNPFVE